MGKRSREKLARRLIDEKQEKPEFQYQTGLEKACIFIIRWGIYLVLFIPLIIDLRFFFPFVAPKTTLFRIIVEIIFAAYLFLIISHSKYRPRISALTIAVTLFLAVFILASFTGINLERSFWSTYERMTGIFTMLHLYALFIILSSVFNRRDDWEKFLGASVIAGVFLSIYVLRGSEVSTRGGGTIGNTSFMGAYLLFDVFFAIILFLSNFLKREGWSPFWQIFSGVSLLIMLPALLTSTAQGAIASFFLGLFLLTLGRLIFSNKKLLKRLAIGIILASIILGIISVLFQPTFVKDKMEGPLYMMQARFAVWEGGLKGFLERPILGWGPENFNVVFLKYFNPCMSLGECGAEVWFDRVHNIIFDTLATTGIFGLLSYLSIFVVAIYGLLMAASRAAGTKNVFIPLGLGALLIVYFIQNLLVFDMINTYLVFFLSLGFISLIIQKPKDFQEETTTRSINPILGLAVISVIAYLLWWGNIKPMMANRYIIKSIGTQYVDQAVLFFQQSLSSSMNKYEAREHFTQRMVRAAAQQDMAENVRPALQKALDAAEVEMEKSIEENSLDFRHYLFLGELYVNSHRFSGDTKKLERAQAVSERAVELSPTNQQGYWQLAEVLVGQGKIGEAIPLLKKAAELEPRVGRSHWYLALAYKIAGDYQSAKEAIIEAEENGFYLKDNLDNLQRVIDIFQAIGDDNALVTFYLKEIELDPGNTRFWALLAASYANLGQYDKAREAAQRAIELNPDMAPQVERFLKSLAE